MRIANVTEVLATASGHPDRFFGSGFRQYQTAATSTTPADRQQHRHVDILLPTPAAAKIVRPPIA
ncbi:MAG: hypothetical protein ACP5QO_09325, partial [Clostridia bacterium]